MQHIWLKGSMPRIHVSMRHSDLLITAKNCVRECNILILTSTLCTKKRIKSFFILTHRKLHSIIT